MIGVICALNLTSIINGIEYLIGHKFLSGDIYFIDFLPSELHWLDVFYVLVTALLLSCWPAGIPPAAPAASTRRGCWSGQ
jgi:lipoprotein-releasing system permease protein